MSDGPKSKRPDRTWEPEDVTRLKKLARAIQVANGWDAVESVESSNLEPEGAVIKAGVEQTPGSEGTS
jgi:hypothetical protein